MHHCLAKVSTKANAWKLESIDGSHKSTFTRSISCCRPVLFAVLLWCGQVTPNVNVSPAWILLFAQFFC